METPTMEFLNIEEAVGIINKHFPDGKRKLTPLRMRHMLDCNAFQPSIGYASRGESRCYGVLKPLLEIYIAEIKRKHAEAQHYLMTGQEEFQS